LGDDLAVVGIRLLIFSLLWARGAGAFDLRIYLLRVFLFMKR
jgi:hypothetical protein